MKKNINGLLIEDNPDDTLLVMKLLSEPGWSSLKFTFACAENLKTAFELLAKGGIEVILLDLNLPDSNGIETFRKVSAQAPGIPVIVLTGMQDEELGLKALGAGAQDYQVKGDINGHAFRRTVSYAVERHRMMTNVQNILNSAPDGMVIVDNKDRVSYLNPAAAALLDGKQAGLPGRPFPFPLPDGAFGEIDIPQAGGTARTAELRVTGIEWDGKPARLISIRDITELRRNERLQTEVFEHQKRDKLKDEFIGVIAHEMRSPLTIVSCIADSLNDGVAGPLSKEQTEMISMQCESIQRLDKGVRRILELSRLESNKAQIQLQRVDTAQLLREMAQTFNMVAVRHNLMFQLEVEPGLPDICADKELMVQVLGNLLDNAMRFARSRISVIAAAASDGGGETPCAAARGYIRISVTDDGRGIPAEHFTELFTKFVQVARVSKGSGYHGMGLGLAICKESIERQNGRIWVESQPDAGTTFHFLLPQFK